MRRHATTHVRALLKDVAANCKRRRRNLRDMWQRVCKERWNVSVSGLNQEIGSDALQGVVKINCPSGVCLVTGHRAAVCRWLDENSTAEYRRHSFIVRLKHVTRSWTFHWSDYCLLLLLLLNDQLFYTRILINVAVTVLVIVIGSQRIIHNLVTPYSTCSC